MLPINHLKKTLDRELGPDRWEFNNNPVGDFFIVHHVGTGHIYKVQLISNAWTSCLWDGKQWVADCFLSSVLNGKPTLVEGKTAAADFNINNEVQVKLTQYGLSLHRSKWQKLYDMYPQSMGDYLPPETDSEGWSAFQLWVLMADYGPYLLNGGKQVFVNNVIRFSKEATQ